VGINLQVAKFLFQENAHRPISGDVLLLARQTVTIPIEQLSKIYKSVRGKELSYTENDIDRTTRHSAGARFVTDEFFFRILSSKIKSVTRLDVSGYEKASIIADLNHPIPRKLHGKYDFIYDGSVLDNVFNPGQMLINVSNMLRPRGRTCLLNVMSAFPGAMVCPQPEFFYSFFAVNKYRDVKVYVTQRLEHGDRFFYRTNLWKYGPRFTRKPGYDYMRATATTDGSHLHIVCIAEKGSGSASIQMPKNLQYIDVKDGDIDWSKMETKYEKSKRPIIHSAFVSRAANKPDYSLFDSDHYTFIASGF